MNSISSVVFLLLKDKKHRNKIKNRKFFGVVKIKKHKPIKDFAHISRKLNLKKNIVQTCSSPTKYKKMKNAQTNTNTNKCKNGGESLGDCW